MMFVLFLVLGDYEESHYKHSHAGTCWLILPVATPHIPCAVTNMNSSTPSAFQPYCLSSHRSHLFFSYPFSFKLCWNFTFLSSSISKAILLALRYFRAIILLHIIGIHVYHSPLIQVSCGWEPRIVSFNFCFLLAAGTYLVIVTAQLLSVNEWLGSCCLWSWWKRSKSKWVLCIH